jgi:glycosyltransferase involved in cell wall biosynthesis
MPAASGPLSFSRDGDGYRVESSLDEGTHRYLYSTQTVGLDVLPPADKPLVYFECDAGVDVTLALIFLASDGERLGHVMIPQMRNVRVVAAEGTAAIRVGLRVAGPGATTIRRYVREEFHERSTGVVPTSRTLVLTNVYPSYDRLYRNAFVHTRVLGYRNEGERIDVAVTGAGARSSYREFQDVDVSTMTSDLLRTTLQGGELDSLLVHFLDEDMWEVIRERSELKGVYVWIHGAEVQPWWRRQYNYVDEESLALAKLASERRIDFWHRVVAEMPDNVHLVFVSQYLAEEVFEDLEVRLPSDRYSIIHNPIDTATFAYTPKPPEQRKRVLSIRTYASRKYANDLSVEAVRLLSDREGFEELEFLFVGDGDLFDETLAPIRDLPNVTVRREFLTQGQMAELHQSYGVFLTPTRWDSQGVSRDEAMASGLVPLTTAVAAVPEFVDEGCAVMTPPEDAASLAEAMWELTQDGDRFLSMSEAAAHRVRQQTSADIVIPRELTLIRLGPSALSSGGRT